MSTPNKPVTPEQALANLRADVELDRIAERVDAMTDEEIDAELAKKGIDPAEMLEKDRAMIERLAPAAKPASNVRDIRSTRRWPIVVAVAATLSVAAAAVLVIGRTGNLPAAFLPEPPLTTTAATGTPTGDTTHPAVSDPQYARFLAYQYFAEGRYAECLNELEKAKKLDPIGDTDETVQSVRHRATDALAPKHTP
jgi:tetratricopeptide (TPR) repeat protein